ncbi:MAG: hypothetical protein KAS93_08160 [Gammaproteobacteria bacterium]|nr:hypothetical protein [Gammaproteobacteria bacterium]
MKAIKTKRYWTQSAVGWLLLAISLSPLHAKDLLPPDDPTQSISYWRQHTISADKDSLAAMAKGVFEVLLRAWDSSRLEPGLYVVKSTAGPWAASLADGNILLSRAAIETCLKFGKHRAEHLLAFILAHELAHQRSDDLWHQRFFRLLGNQGHDVKKLLLTELQSDKKVWMEVGQKETQADHDGLTMMSSVGYDPYQVLDKKDFFTAWVENIWQESCSQQKHNQPNSQACKQAKRRAMHAHAQLTAVATQATLYEMGVQAFIAGQYKLARRYLTAYGRNYTNRAVLSALGLTHFAEAMMSYQQLVNEYGIKQPAYYYPLLLDASATVLPARTGQSDSSKRSALDAEMKKIKQKMQDSIRQSIKYYEKAVRLEPENPRTYLLLAYSYLLDSNAYMVRGIMQGKYIPQFGHDSAAELILAMTSGIEGKTEKAEKDFARLIEHISKPFNDGVIPADLLIYSSYFNSSAYAQYLGKKDKAAALWKKLATYARAQSRPMLFQLAVGHVTNRALVRSIPSSALNIRGLRLGDNFPVKQSSSQTNLKSDLWIEGDKFEVYRFKNGSRYVVNSSGKLVNAWQDSARVELDKGIAMGNMADRALKSLGMPNRQLHMMSGEYLAYDAHGLAVHVVQDKIAGWFLYSPQ